MLEIFTFPNSLYICGLRYATVVSLSDVSALCILSQLIRFCGEYPVCDEALDSFSHFTERRFKTESEHGDKLPESELQCEWSQTLDLIQGHSAQPPLGVEEEGGAEVPSAPCTCLLTRRAQPQELLQEEGPGSPGQVIKLERLGG